LFFAVDIPRDPALDVLSDSLSKLSMGIKPTEPNRQHITLKFIGDPPCPFDKVAKAAALLEGKFRELTLHPLGFGAFPDWRCPSVLWIGLDPQDDLVSLAGALDRALNKVCGVPLERRAFKAHLTTARVRAPDKLDISKVRELHSKALGELIDHGFKVIVRELGLYNSNLTSKGPVYDRLRTFHLTADTDRQ
jgi:2'-5' RNA ligase